MGERSNIKLERLPYKPGRPSVITYTSGTTGNPKGVVHTNDGINSMISIYNDTNGFGLAGDCRNLVLIPPMYLTSLVHSIITPLAMGTTNILQPIYNPNTLGDDLKEWEPKLVVASKAHYLNLEKSRLPKGSLYKTTSAYCGGEAISKSTAIRIDKVLDYFGIPPMIIGYGQTEFGTMAMFSNYIPDRTNESGMLLPNVKAKILNQVTGEPTERGKRGILYISTPAIMKEYINNPEATKEFFSIDEDGTVWGKTGDIAEVKYQYDGKDVYEVSGRASDSFVDENGKVVYLFDIENQVEDVQYVNQAEVVSVTLDDGKKVPIVHVILDKKASKIGEDIVKLIDATLKANIKNPNAIPYAYKIRDSFETSPISGKRDYAVLKYETDGFIRIDDEGNTVPITIDSKESKEQNDLVKSRIMVKKTTF
jgi:acyl-coenzyme A synthetase/AMP-(fatty) acid ligase